MKCDELKEYKAYEYGTSYVYDIGEVKAAIAELKQFAEDACLERDDNQNAIDELRKEIESLKASHYAEMVDAGMRERRLRRALWIARAWFCGRSCEYFSGMASRCKIGQEDFYSEVSERARRYMVSSYKCRTKAEEYK